MKKKCLIFVAFLSVFFTSPSFAETSLVVTKVEGLPLLIREGKETPLATGEIQEADIIKTAENSQVDFAVNGKVGCRLLASSECTVLQNNEKMTHLDIRHGNGIFNLKKLSRGSTFKVETPTAVASVRGTQFWGRVNTQEIHNPVTTFAVRNGSVDLLIKSTEETYTLRKGQAIDIHKFKLFNPVAVRRALKEEMEAMEQASDIPTSAS